MKKKKKKSSFSCSMQQTLNFKDQKKTGLPFSFDMIGGSGRNWEDYVDLITFMIERVKIEHGSSVC